MKIEVYRDRKRQWRARVVARNGRIIWMTSEAYRRRVDVMGAVTLLKRAVNAKVIRIKEKRNANSSNVKHRTNRRTKTRKAKGAADQRS